MRQPQRAAAALRRQQRAPRACVLAEQAAGKSAGHASMRSRNDWILQLGWAVTYLRGLQRTLSTDWAARPLSRMNTG